MQRLRPALAVVALALASTACSLVLDFSEALVDGGPEPDVGTTDAVLVDVDPLAPDAPPSPRTVFEPNNTFEQATPFSAGSYGPIAIYPAGDHDFFEFELAAPSDVTIDVLFMQANGDLDMKLYDGALNQIGSSAGFVDNEQIVRSAAMGGQLGPGTFFIEVYGYNNTYVNENYTLALTVI